MFCFVLFWFGFVCLFVFEESFHCIQGLGIWIQAFSEPTELSSDCRLIRCETVKPGLTLQSTSRRALWVLIPVAPVQRKFCILATRNFQVSSECWMEQTRSSIMAEIWKFAVNMVRLRRWARACDLSTLPFSGRQHPWLCNYYEFTPIRIHDKGYYRAAWPEEG